jgi:hypothetical protein
VNAAKIGVPDGVSGAEVQDSPADGGDEWPAASVLSVAAPLRANADFGSKVAAASLRARCLARSETRRWFRPGGGCYTARQSDFMPANAPEDALFESVP